MRWPGIEPGSTAWKATMLTITPPSQNVRLVIQKVFPGFKETILYKIENITILQKWNLKIILKICKYLWYKKCDNVFHIAGLLYVHIF
jgi:hypothetical protein